jgi:hypothetical protein
MVSDILVFKVQLVYRDSAVKWLHYQKYWTGFSFYVGYFEESSWEQIINDEEVKIWAGFFSLRGKRKGNKRNPLDGCSKTCMGEKKARSNRRNICNRMMEQQSSENGGKTHSTWSAMNRKRGANVW